MIYYLIKTIEITYINKNQNKEEEEGKSEFNHHLAIMSTISALANALPIVPPVANASAVSSPSVNNQKMINNPITPANNNSMIKS